MAAESPRRVVKPTGAIARPFPVSDKSVMESVVEFIHDVVPQSYSGSPKTDEKDAIMWVKFAYADINDLSTCEEDLHHNGNITPLLLILGYSNGVQIWTLPANGEGQEVLSWRQGAVRALCLLPTPDCSYNTQDFYLNRRPLVAMCDSSSAGPQFCSVTFVSLKTGDQVNCIKFKTPVCHIQCNKRVIVVAFKEQIAVFDACSFKDRFTITSCYPSPGPNLNPIAIGTQWLAYADKNLVSVHQSCGGVVGSGAQSYTATVIHAAMTLTKGLTMFSETVASSFGGSKGSASQSRKDYTTEAAEPKPGVVTVIDLKNIGEGEVNVLEDRGGEGIIAHFVAHADPVAAMQFDCSGALLLTADRPGHNFHLFRILPHPSRSSLGAVHHLYTLYRGDTSAKVQDITFSLDSRWVAVSTQRGTTHIFPITPYGGPVTVRTHTPPRVVNRLSRFHKSAGLEDIQPSATGRNSPVLPSGSPGTSGGIPPSPRSAATQGGQIGRPYDSHPSIPYNGSAAGRMGNPRFPPYPHPTVVPPLAQIRQSAPFAGFTCSGGSRSPPTKGLKSSSSQTIGESFNVVAAFAPPRCYLVGSPGIAKDKNDKRSVDSLFIYGCNGILIEYALDPRPSTGVTKPNDDSPLELSIAAMAQWQIVRSCNSPEVKPPLPSTNPLMISQEIILSLKNERQHGGSRTLSCGVRGSRTYSSGSESDEPDDCWLSQVEIITHAGPHRRLWMGPQFTFKTFQHPANTTILNPTSSALLGQGESSNFQGMDIFMEEFGADSIGSRLTPRSTPMAMPGVRPSGPLLIEAGSAGSFEQSPGMFEACGSWPSSSSSMGHGLERHSEDQLREILADAMLESPVARRDGGAICRNASAEFQGSSEELSTSSSQSGSVSQASDARISPPHFGEHLLVFPGNTTPPASPVGRTNRI